MPYLKFSRQEWSALRGPGQPVSVRDSDDVYGPLARLLNLRIMAARDLSRVVETEFLGRRNAPSPFVIAVAGSVAVGKSTFARALQAALACWPEHPRVELVTTDSFLLPMRELEELGLTARKGFPESYDLPAMLAFLAALKAGDADLKVPVYSHDAYDIMPGNFQKVDQPDILILEGLNVLQAVAGAPSVASDYFDFSIYLDAATADIEQWFLERLLLLQTTAHENPSSYFYRFKDLTLAEFEAIAHNAWQNINLPNLMDNILPTRERANLVIRVDKSHAVEEICLRRI